MHVAYCIVEPPQEVESILCSLNSQHLVMIQIILSLFQQWSGVFHAGIGVRGYIADEEEQLLRLENRFETREEDQTCFQPLPLLAFAEPQLLAQQLFVAAPLMCCCLTWGLAFSSIRSIFVACVAFMSLGR